MNKVNQSIDFLSIRPKWNRRWERTQQNLVVILIPKFGNHAFGRWLMARMKRPNYRLKLDKIGSFVWERCNGTQNVKEIGEQLKEEFGEEVEPVYDRLRLFFRQLEQSRSINWYAE